jgi:hypothetical protein
MLSPVVSDRNSAVIYYELIKGHSINSFKNSSCIDDKIGFCYDLEADRIDLLYQQLNKSSIIQFNY